MVKGIITKSMGLWYTVKTEEDNEINCRIIGKLRLSGIKSTNPVAVGDYVHIEMLKEEKGVGSIVDVLPRSNYVSRQSPRKKHQVHLIAANIDQAILIVTMVNPKLKQGFIDRFLIMTETHNIPTTIVFNKSDLYNESHLEIYHLLHEIYSSIGHNTLLTSGVTLEGKEQLISTLKDKTSLISGQSGVGKSTLVNMIQPGLELITTELSDFTGKGQHTTTFAEMHKLSFGGYIIDTPGIKTLSFNNLEPMDIAHNFREIFTVSKNCKFHNCTHQNEPKCAVKEAVEKGEIFLLRYQNYLSIVQELKDQNYWERHKEI
jgi:ribosome biogenesis GTPase